jgi:hypothetical protein
VAVLKVGYPWKIGGRKSGREPCRNTQARAEKQVTAGMLATARIPAATGTLALSKEHKQEKPQPLEQNASNSRIRVEKQVAGNEARMWP